MNGKGGNLISFTHFVLPNLKIEEAIVYWDMSPLIHEIEEQPSGTMWKQTWRLDRN